MKLGKVEKTTVFYYILCAVVKFIHDVIFYRKVMYSGKENIPKDKPVIFAPNHQNALMDALALLFAVDKPVVFLARSDIFKGGIISRLLFFFKILPVYRIRDGKEKLKFNEQVFNKNIELLKLKKFMTIFPEAQHIDKRHLRPVKKGIQKVAFMAEEANNFSLDIQVVPVGIYYSNYWNYRTHIRVMFGKPIAVKDYIDVYKEKPAQAIVQLGKEISDKMKRLMIDIQNLDYYEEYELLRHVCNETVREKYDSESRAHDRYMADKQIISKLDKLSEENPETFESIMNTTKEYKTLIDKNEINDNDVKTLLASPELFTKFMLLLAGFPLYLYGLSNNFIPYFLPSKIVKRLKDRQFESSVKFGIGLISFPLIFLIQFIAVSLFVPNILWALLYLVSIPFAGVFAYEYRRAFLKFRRLLKLKSSNDKELIISKRDEIIRKFNFIEK